MDGPKSASSAENSNGAAGGSKPPVVRSARACTVCRNAKMRCIGAEDGAQKCQRCKRQNLECIFEKHRRGRKPGSKLSEHSKMLRRLERESKAKVKEQQQPLQSPQQQPQHHQQQASTSTIAATPVQPPPIQTAYNVQPQPATVPPTVTATTAAGIPPAQPPLDILTSSEHYNPSSLHSGSSGVGSTPTQVYQMPLQVTYPSSEARQTDRDSIGDSTPDADDAIFPARVVDRESKRQSFFRTILNPTDGAESATVAGERPKNEMERVQMTPSPSRPIIYDPNVQDPITLGLLDEQEAKVLFDLVFMRLNGFINLFDPRLHTVPYVRSRSPFLFSCLIMAGCKFWKAELYRQCQQIAHSFAVKAFAEGWQSVETVQAFACLVYWKEPDDTRTWGYIGYACRMAVELGLNIYVGHPEGESDDRRRERRNRERTYLILWVHDRALSMQTGRNWMLPEDDLVRHAKSWHDDAPMRPEDVIVAAMVNLRQIAAETTDVYRMQKGGGTDGHYSDVNHEMLLRGCNSKLTAWMDFWDAELKRAGGQAFHYSFLGFFRLHVRLFLNSLGLTSTSTPLGRTSPSLQALSICYTSAIQSLEIITRQFAPWGLLRYGQDSMTTMSAYSAVFLIKLLRRTQMLHELAHTASHDIHELISQTADAYQEAALLAVSSSSAAYHARFLRVLVAKDAESQVVRRTHRTSMSSSRGSPDGRDDIQSVPARGSSTSLPSYTPIHPNPPHSLHGSHPTSPQYPSFPVGPHATLPPPALHGQTPQMSPIDTKPPLGYPPRTPASAHASNPPSSAGGYGHYNGVEYGHQPTNMVVSYPPVLQNSASELDMRYSRNLLQELGYPLMTGIEPAAEWFTQAMGPSGCAGLL